MIGCHQLAIADRRLFGGRKVIGFLRAFERADQILGHPISHGIGVADRHAAAALIEKRDAQPHQFYQPIGQRAANLQRAAKLHHAQHLFGAMRQIAREALLKIGQLIRLDRIAQTRIPIGRGNFGNPAHCDAPKNERSVGGKVWTNSGARQLVN